MQLPQIPVVLLQLIGLLGFVFLFLFFDGLFFYRYLQDLGAVPLQI